MDDQERKDTEEKAKIYVKERNKSKGRAFDSVVFFCIGVVIVCFLIAFLISH